MVARYLRQIVERLYHLTLDSAPRRYFDSCKDREPLSDEQFYHRFYANTPVTYDTCCQVRRTLQTQLCINNPRPDDNLARIYPDVDLAEICWEIGEELNLDFHEEAITSWHGTIDSLLHTVERLRKESRL